MSLLGNMQKCLNLKHNLKGILILKILLLPCIEGCYSFFATKVRYHFIMYTILQCFVQNYAAMHNSIFTTTKLPEKMPQTPPVLTIYNID